MQPRNMMHDLQTIREVIEGPQTIVEKDVVGDKVAIEQFTDAFLKLVGAYAIEMKMTRLDLFLGINNLHKLVIADMAAQFAADGTPPERTYRMADQQFHHAMRELAYPGQGSLNRKARRRSLANAE